MNKGIRSENAARNAAVSVGARLTEQILAFVSRTVFIWFLSEEYLGVTSLFANILNVLNLTELGLATAINVALYKPLAAGDKEKIKSFLKIYRTAYYFVGIAVLVIGVGLVPFLPYLMKGTTDVVNVTVVYLMYVAKNVLSYWLFAYKRSILEADQQGYILNVFSYGLQCVFKIVQIVLLFLFKSTPQLSFYIYCANDVVVSVCCNLAISSYVNKKYPFIKEKNVAPLSKSEKTDLVKNVYGVSLNRISATLNGSADSIIISAFIGTVILGLYSNYLLLGEAVRKMLTLLFSSLVPSIGNLNVTESVEKKRKIFNTLHFASFWINGFCVICLWNLLNPFLVSVWLGSKFRLSNLVVFALCMNYLVDWLMGAPLQFRNACGLYWQSRYRAIVAILVNVALSIIAAKVLNWGIPGILLATIISRLAVTLWVDTYLVHKHVLHTSPKPYFLKYFASLALVIATGGLIKVICLWMPEDSILFFIIRTFLCVLIPNLLWWLMFRKTKEFQFLLGFAKRIVHKVLKRNHKNAV
ncbi:MAG: hypothetical protein Q3985_04485 [Eubacteriales bacterium]|nr:hypothetical protein [Eubacteriales bacterium]